MARRTPMAGSPGFYTRNGRVETRATLRNGTRKWVSGATKAQATKERARVEAASEGGSYQGTSPRFDAHAAEWVETFQGRKGRGLSTGTRNGYRQTLVRAVAFFGRIRLHEISAPDVVRYGEWLAEQTNPRSGDTLSDDTVRLHIATVKVMLADAKQRGLILHNPADGVWRTGRTTPPREAMHTNVVALLLRQIERHDPHWLLFFQTLLLTGLRIGELIELRWRDVDLDAGTVSISRRVYKGEVDGPKTKASVRTLPLEPGLAKELRRLHMRTSPQPDDLLFTSPATGGRVNPSSLSRDVLKPAAVEVGLGEWQVVGQTKRGHDIRRAVSLVSFHTFRHTSASLLYAADWDDVQVRDWLGHTDANFTKSRYVHRVAALPTPTFPDEVAARRARKAS